MLVLVIVPLRHTARIARRIGQGDLHQRVEWRSKDDLGAIATELNRLAIRLRDLRETESGRRQMEFQLIDAVVRSIFEPVIVTDGRGQILKLNQAAVEVLGGWRAIDRMMLATTPGGDKILNAIRAAVSMQRATTAEEGEAALLPMRIGHAERSFACAPRRCATRGQAARRCHPAGRRNGNRGGRPLQIALPLRGLANGCTLRSIACVFRSIPLPRAMPGNCVHCRRSWPTALPKKPSILTI